MKATKSTRTWLWAVVAALYVLPVLTGTVPLGTQLATLAPGVGVLVLLIVTTRSDARSSARLSATGSSRCPYALILQGAIEDGLVLGAEALRRNTTKKSRASNACVLAIGYTRSGRLEAGRRQIVTAMRLDPDNELIERALAELDDAGRAAVPERR